MKFLDFLKKRESASSGKFSNFFREASEEEKKRVFTEAARRANQEQRKVFFGSDTSPEMGK